MRHRFGPHRPDATFVAHEFAESRVDLGEVTLNFAETGAKEAPTLLLIPSQTESWWGYQEVMKLLAPNYHVFAVDLRGQGRSSRTPGRYTIDNIGNDLVRFLDAVVGNQAIVAGLSSGGVLSAWLSAYAKPGQIRACYYEDPPLFASELTPGFGNGIRQSEIGKLFKLFATFLGDQWSIGDWDGAVEASRCELPAWVAQTAALPRDPPQNLKEYDPEWARAFWSGTATVGCDQATMLGQVRVPVLFTHHFREIHPVTGALMGAISDFQVDRVRSLVEGAGQPFVYRSLPEMGHSMHGQDPAQYVAILNAWVGTLT